MSGTLVRGVQGIWSAKFDRNGAHHQQRRQSQSDGMLVECTMVFDDTGIENPNIGILTTVEPPHTLVGEEPSIGFRSTQTFTPDGDGTLITVIQEGLPPELVGNPEVIEAFRSSYRKLGRVLRVETQERDCS